jgi:hypothetical protein
MLVTTPDKELPSEERGGGGGPCFLGGLGPPPFLPPRLTCNSISIDNYGLASDSIRYLFTVRTPFGI